MDKQIRDADFVLMICTETYYRRVMGDEKPGTGLGVRWEGHLIYQYISNAGMLNTRFIPVLLESGKSEHIPAPVQGVAHYFAQTEEGYEWDIMVEEAARLLNQAALYSKERGQYAETEPLYKRALAVFEKALGPDHPNAATVLGNYAALLHVMQRDAEAAEMEARAEAIQAKYAQQDSAE